MTSTITPLRPFLLFLLLLLTTTITPGVVVVAQQQQQQQQHCQWSSPSKGLHWTPKEGHHEPSTALIGNTASVWTYTSGRSQDDPRRYQVRYKLHNNNNTTTTTAKIDFKYEFNCATLPKLAISADGTTFAVGCTQQDVTLYSSGEVLKSKQGFVTVFRWQPHKNKCQVLGNLYGTLKEEQFGRGLALNEHGDILAIAGNEPSHLYVYQYDFDNKQWNPRGQTLEERNHKVLLSNDGTILPTIQMQNKAVQILHYSDTNNQWEVEPFLSTIPTGVSNPTAAAVVLGRSSSLSLSGNGQVAAVQRYDKRYGELGVAIYHRAAKQQLDDSTNSSFAWESDPFIGFIPSGGRHSTFGMVTSMNYDGTRIAIAEPAHNDGYGRVYVYDLQYNNNDGRDLGGFGWVPQGDPIVGKYTKDAFGRQLWLSQDGNTLVIRSISYSLIYEYQAPKCLSDGRTDFY